MGPARAGCCRVVRGAGRMELIDIGVPGARASATTACVLIRGPAACRAIVTAPVSKVTPRGLACMRSIARLSPRRACIPTRRRIRSGVREQLGNWRSKRRRSLCECGLDLLPDRAPRDAQLGHHGQLECHARDCRCSCTSAMRTRLHRGAGDTCRAWAPRWHTVFTDQVAALDDASKRGFHRDHR